MFAHVRRSRLFHRSPAASRVGSLTVVGIAVLAGFYAALAGSGSADQAGPPATVEDREEQTTPHVVFIDAGHGGRDPGWGSFFVAGIPTEKELTLDLAKRTARQLEALGFKVVLSRESDTDVNEPERDINGDGVEDIVDELQARVDKANAAGASVLLSVHFNGLPDTALRGAGTYYNTEREFSDANRELAELLQEAQMEALAALGHEARDWGALADDTFHTPAQSKLDTGYHYNTLIGPAGPFRTRPSMMPGVIVEPLFLTDPAEGRLATRPDVREALAVAYADAIKRFLGDRAKSPQSAQR